MYEYPFLKLYRQLFKPNKGDDAEYKKNLLKFLRNVSNPSKSTLHKIIVLCPVRPNSRLNFFISEKHSHRNRAKQVKHIKKKRTIQF